MARATVARATATCDGRRENAWRTVTRANGASREDAPTRESVTRTVANDRALWLENWFACENPRAVRVLASMPVARCDARLLGGVDARTGAWVSGGTTLGMRASAQGDEAMVRELANVVGAAHLTILDDDDGRFAIHHAAAHGHANVVRALAEIGCDVNAKDECDGSTPLILAACFERTEVFDVLLDLGADVTVRDFGNATCAGHLAQRAPRMNAQLSRVLKIAGPGGCGRLKRGEKSYLTKRKSLKRELESLDVQSLVDVAVYWRANVRNAGSPPEKAKLIDLLLACTP